MSKIGAVFGCTLAVVVIAACGEEGKAQRAAGVLEPLPPPRVEEESRSSCACFCGDNDPHSSRYNCVPEFYACGRTCESGCTDQGEDTYVCGPPNDGTAWAPPNCTAIGLGCEFGTIRYCCGCGGPPSADA